MYLLLGYFFFFFIFSTLLFQMAKVELRACLNFMIERKASKFYPMDRI